MANTTNFGWETPDDTDLVKDGAAAIRTLGSAIDTSLVDLKGGTTGQVLAKASDTDMDFTWSSVDPLTILDAKGDLITATAADTPARLAVGTNGQVLTANSATSTGLEWQNISSGGMTLISTATPSAATTVSFTSIPTTYKTLLLVWNNIFQSVGDVFFNVRLNNDSSGNHWYAGTFFAAGSCQATNAADDTAFGNATYSSPIPATRTTGGNQQQNANGQMWIFNADQTTDKKRVSWSSSGWSVDQNTYAGPIMMNGIYTGGSAISRIDFNRSSTQTITGTIRLYGVA